MPATLLLVATALLAGCGDDPASAEPLDTGVGPGPVGATPMGNTGLPADQQPPSSAEQSPPSQAGAAAPPMTQRPEPGLAGGQAPSPNTDATDGGAVDAGVVADASTAGPVDAASADAGDGEPDSGAPRSEPCTGRGGMVLQQTIVVARGETFDGQCQRYIAGRALGDGSQSESQQPVFRLEDGARLVNVVLGSPAADGIHTYGDVTLQNIVWEDIGEDALTIKESGTVELTGGSAVDGEDKVFQINAASTFRVSDFRADNAGKLIRQNGGTTFRVDVYIDRCDISNMDEAIFRTDSSSSTVTMTNTRYHNIGDELFRGVNPRNITQSGNQQY